MPLSLCSITLNLSIADDRYHLLLLVGHSFFKHLHHYRSVYQTVLQCICHVARVHERGGVDELSKPP